MLDNHPTIVFFRFYYDMDSDLKQYVALLSVNRLDLAQHYILNHLLLILNARAGVSQIDQFILESCQNNDNYLFTAWVRLWLQYLYFIYY